MFTNLIPFHQLHCTDSHPAHVGRNQAVHLLVFLPWKFSQMVPSSILIVGGGGVGTIVALNLTAGDKAVVTLVLRSNYTMVQTTGFKIDSVDHGHLEPWRPHRGM